MQPITHCHHRAPRAGVDTITTSNAAFAMLALAIHRPLRSETVVLALDGNRCGRAIVSVTGTTAPGSILDVVELIAHGVYSEVLGGLAVATVRPQECAPNPGDIDRWLEASDIAATAGVELLEWFVVGKTVRCPRDELGEAPRW